MPNVMLSFTYAGAFTLPFESSSNVGQRTKSEPKKMAVVKPTFRRQPASMIGSAATSDQIRVRPQKTTPQKVSARKKAYPAATDATATMSELRCELVMSFGSGVTCA